MLSPCPHPVPMSPHPQRPPHTALVVRSPRLGTEAFRHMLVAPWCRPLCLESGPGRVPGPVFTFTPRFKYFPPGPGPPVNVNVYGEPVRLLRGTPACWGGGHRSCPILVTPPRTRCRALSHAWRPGTVTRGVPYTREAPQGGHRPHTSTEPTSPCKNPSQEATSLLLWGFVCPRDGKDTCGDRGGCHPSRGGGSVGVLPPLGASLQARILFLWGNIGIRMIRIGTSCQGSPCLA